MWLWKQSKWKHNFSFPFVRNERAGRRVSVLAAVIAKDYLKAVKAFICLQELWHMVRNGLKIYCHLCWMRFKVFFNKDLVPHHPWKNPSEIVKHTESRQSIRVFNDFFFFFFKGGIKQGFQMKERNYSWQKMNLIFLLQSFFLLLFFNVRPLHHMH